MKMKNKMSVVVKYWQTVNISILVLVAFILWQFVTQGQIRYPAVIGLTQLLQAVTLMSVHVTLPRHPLVETPK